MAASDGFTTTTTCSNNTLNIIPEYEELTMALAIALAAMAFVRIRRKAQEK